MEFDTREQAFSAYLSIMGRLLKKFTSQYAVPEVCKQLGRTFIALSTASKSQIAAKVEQLSALYDDLDQEAEVPDS